MLNPNMPELFVGKSQQDEGEPDTFDGTIWAAPTQEWRDQAGGGPDPDVTTMAERIKYEEDAARLVLAWNVHDDLLAALEAVIGSGQLPPNGPTLALVRTVLKKAKGEQP